MTKFYDISRLCIRLYYILDQKKFCTPSLEVWPSYPLERNLLPPSGSRVAYKKFGHFVIKDFGNFVISEQIVNT